MIVTWLTSCQKRVMIARNQLTVVMWAPCPWSHPTGKECNVITKRIAIVLGHFVNRTVLNLTRCIEMIHFYAPGYPVHRNESSNDKSYLFLPNHRRKRHSFAHVDLRAAMFSPPSCIAVDSSDRLFHDLSRKPRRTGCPFLPKQRFKHNVLNTSCHVHDKDGDITPVSYRTEKKIYSFLTMCKQWHVSCK